MLEVFKRVGAFLKYGLQGVIAITLIITFIIERIDKFSALGLFVGLLFIGLIEVLARIIVWIISGYFEAHPKSNMSSTKLKQMREYYTYYNVKNKLSKTLKKHKAY